MVAYPPQAPINHILGYETQIGAIAEPVTSALANAHTVIVYNSTLVKTMIWTRSNNLWVGVEAL